ncbi:MHS family proline/betaine transporter-like MFS transporter [Arthrobacter sp. 1088]|uniref:MFS transporter n=1 Tax=Arthrobacter sp. 1088 TaxID=2817768 RepID=UPI00285FCAEC|nr:MFS transporter [Arthrobacter sp. 1088]MDR6686683.1 MHS family proline/betaine transporter-like MFS transporter [Arthrobacter sp. 1088]
MNTMTEKVAETESSPRRSLKRVAAAAAVGNFVEWFDSAAYAVMSVTIAKLFFPDYSTTASLLAVWAIFAGGFIARPLGAAFFGRYGDRIGRNKMLGLCVLIMSAATFCIGILPTFAVIGIWAPILLFVFRAVQGFTTGGEYTGSSAFIVEYAPEGKRATYASIIPATVGLASVAGALLGAAITATLSPADLQAWGWRIPFLLAAPLGLIGLYIRSRVDDTPVFRGLEKKGKVAKKPLGDAIRLCARQIFTLFGYSITNAIAYYLMSSYMIAYMTSSLHYSSTESMITSVVTMLVYTAVCPLAARASDRYGRKRMLLVACVGFVVMTIPAFSIMPLGLGFAILGTSVLGALVAVIGTSNVPALVEMFPSSVRASGSAIGYTLAYVLFGGTAPFVATGLVAGFGTPLAPAFYLMGMALVSAVVVVLFFRETKDLSLSRTTVL